MRCMDCGSTVHGHRLMGNPRANLVWLCCKNYRVQPRQMDENHRMLNLHKNSAHNRRNAH